MWKIDEAERWFILNSECFNFLDILSRLIRVVLWHWYILVYLQALAGEVGMSSELDEVAKALFNGQIPFIWRRLAPVTLKSLGNWIIHFERRYKQYHAWVSVGVLMALARVGVEQLWRDMTLMSSFRPRHKFIDFKFILAISYENCLFRLLIYS